MLTSTERTPEHRRIDLQPVGPHPGRHVINAGRRSVSYAVDRARPTETVDLNVVCIRMGDQLVTFDQLQQVDDVQQEEDAA